MSLSEWEYLLFVSETSLESSEFYATNPFANNIEELHTLSTQAEIAPLDMSVDLFLDDVMSDNVSNIEQNSQIAHTGQANSSKMSFDSTELANETPMNYTNVWPPLNTSVIVTGDWPNSNREVATSSDISMWVENMNVGMTLGEITPHLGTSADPLGSGVPVFDSSRNTLGDTAITPSESQPGKRKTRKGVTLQNYVSTTPPLLGPSTLRLERTATPQHSDTGSTMIIDTEVEVPHETILTTKTIHKIDIFLQLETGLLMTKVLLLHTTLDPDMIRTNVTPGLTALHTDPHTNLRIDTTLALDIDHAPIPEITNSQNIQIRTDPLQDQETLDFLDLVHTPIPETKLI